MGSKNSQHRERNIQFLSIGNLPEIITSQLLLKFEQNLIFTPSSTQRTSDKDNDKFQYIFSPFINVPNKCTQKVCAPDLQLSRLTKTLRKFLSKFVKFLRLLIQILFFDRSRPAVHQQCEQNLYLILQKQRIIVLIL